MLRGKKGGAESVLSDEVKTRAEVRVPQEEKHV